MGAVGAARDVSSVLDAAVAASDPPEGTATESGTGEAGGQASPAQQRAGVRAVAVISAAAAALAAGIVGGVVTVDRAHHDAAVADAEASRSLAVAAATSQRAALALLEDAAREARGEAGAIATEVLVHQDLLGGADAVAPVRDAQADLVALLTELLGTAEPTASAEIVVAAPVPSPRPVDPALSTERLRALAERFRSLEVDATTARTVLAARHTELDTVRTALRDGLTALAATIPAQKDALVAGHGHASADTQAAAAAAAEALVGAADGADLAPLFAAYASAASGVIGSHDAEVARIAAEEAAKAAQAAAARRSGGGSGAPGGSSGAGSVTGGVPQQGVLGETNAARAGNGLGGLAWNGTLASRSCAFAAELASVNGNLYHSGFAGGFSGWAENVAYGYGSPAAVVAGWMASSGHRANILGDYTMMGACSSTSATGRVYWVQQFGR